MNEFKNEDRVQNKIYGMNKLKNKDESIKRVIKKDEEPKWIINESLYTCIYNKMPKDVSIEEKIMYIYCKLCKELVYDEGYLYNDEFDGKKYTSKFSKEHLENIKPNSKVTCWDFARIYTKLVNEIDKVDAMILVQNNNGEHFSTLVNTKNISVLLEAINIKNGEANDLMKMKSGLCIEGIEIINDEEGLIKKAVDKVYPYIFGKKPKSIEKYIEKLKNLQEENYGKDIEKKIQTFINFMKKSNLIGNEAVQALNIFHKFGFFGDNFEKVFLGKKEGNGKNTNFKRIVFMQSIEKEQEKNETGFLLDTTTLELSKQKVEDIARKMFSGEIVYEDKRYKIKDQER